MTETIAFGDFELDEARFELRKLGVVLTVQPKVLDLLLYLARHRDRVVGKGELLERVWEGTAVTEASLTQALSLARRAVGDSPHKQWALRTVRRRGVQFVAPVSTTLAPDRTPLPKVVYSASNTTMETEGGEVFAHDGADEQTQLAPCLIAALHCDAVEDGSCHWSLADVDEVRVGRGSRRTSRLVADIATHLDITIAGRQVSRRHARFVDTPDGWMVVDAGSRNGVFVNGVKVDKQRLEPGDVIGCGRTLFRFELGPSHAVRATRPAPSMISTATPGLLHLDRDLVRIAASDVPVLLVGASGVGKTHVANHLHRGSAREGMLIRVDAASCGEAWTEWLVAAEHGTLLVENVDRLSAAAAHAFANAWEQHDTVRVVATSIAGTAALARTLDASLLTRLCGFVAELPPLSQRIGDLGELIASLGVGHLHVTEEAGLALMRHDWPGNVRGLFLALRSALALADGQPIALRHLPRAVQADAVETEAVETDALETDAVQNCH